MRFSVIIPTLNEGKYIGRLLDSLRVQSVPDLEVIVVDGGSSDATAYIAQSLGAKVFVLKESGEFAARNFGAAEALGSIFVFTCADIIFPPNLLRQIEASFHRSDKLVAITCPDIPYDGSITLKFEYSVYNLIRSFTSKLTGPLKRFSTSTNFLAIRREAFEECGGFGLHNVNADGMLGRQLARQYPVKFDNSVAVYSSARREANWGILRFNLHYLYVLENFFNGISGSEWFMRLKNDSLGKHKELHLATKE